MNTQILLMILFFSMSCFAEKVKVSFGADCEKMLNSVIAKSREEVRVAVYAFTRRSIAKSLVEAKKRGVQVRVLVDASQSRNAHQKKILTRLRQARIPVRIIQLGKWSSMHHKFIIVDDRRVATGSFNYTSSASTRHAENLLVVFSEAVAKKYGEAWQRLWALKT